MVLVAALKQHPTHTGVQQQGCAALGRLAYGDSVQQVSIAKADGIEMLLAALKQHPTNAAVQAVACLALHHLAHENPNNEAAIAEAGSIQLVIKTMATDNGATTYNKVYGQMLLTILSLSALKNSKPRMQEEACNALAIITMFGHPDEQVAIVKKGGIEAVVSVLKQRSHGAVGTTGVQDQCCLVLQELAKTSDNLVIIAKAGGNAVFDDCEMYDGF